MYNVTGLSLHGSRYDAGAMSVTPGEKYFSTIQLLFLHMHDIKFFDNLIGWMLANAGDTINARIEIKSIPASPS